MTVSLCKHSFPDLDPQSPVIHLGPCRGCGTTYEVLADRRQQAETPHRPAA